MEYKETINKGLKRSYEVTVPSSEVEAQVNNKILEIQKYLPEIQSKTNPYDICEKRIIEIISTTT